MSSVNPGIIDRTSLRLGAIALFIPGIPALIGGGLGGVYLVGHQIVTWAHTGKWPSMPVTYGAAILLEPGPHEQTAPLWSWLVAPDDWIGLHKILEHFPSALALLLIGVVGLAITGAGMLRWNQAEELSAQRTVDEQRARAERGLK